MKEAAAKYKRHLKKLKREEEAPEAKRKICSTNSRRPTPKQRQRLNSRPRPRIRAIVKDATGAPSFFGAPGDPGTSSLPYRRLF